MSTPGTGSVVEPPPRGRDVLSYRSSNEFVPPDDAYAYFMDLSDELSRIPTTSLQIFEL